MEPLMGASAAGKAVAAPGCWDLVCCPCWPPSGCGNAGSRKRASVRSRADRTGAEDNHGVKTATHLLGFRFKTNSKLVGSLSGL
jgi:hypothetical protein